MSSNPESIVETGDQHITQASFPAAEPMVSKGNRQSTKVNDIWDRLGIAGSVLCVLHCVLTPFLIGYLSAVGMGFVGDEIVHKILAIVLLVVAVLAFAPGYKKHANKAVIAAGGAGVALIVGGGLVLEPFIGHGLEIGLTIAGSVLLVGAHGANWRLNDCSDECC